MAHRNKKLQNLEQALLWDLILLILLAAILCYIDEYLRRYALITLLEYGVTSIIRLLKKLPKQTSWKELIWYQSLLCTDDWSDFEDAPRI